MIANDDEDDDFEQLMQEIDSEARQAADAYFNNLYETSHGRSCHSSGEDVAEESSVPLEDLSNRQRKGGLKFKLAASPTGDFPVSHYSNYNQGRWVLMEGREYCEISIVINNSREDLQSLKRAISYYFLPSTNPFGTIKSYVSSMNYADAFKYVERFVFKDNHLDGTEESLSIISSDMLNQALDECKVQAYPHSYYMLFFYINFWLSVSVQQLIPSELCLDVDVNEIDTPERRRDVYDYIAANFVGWKPFTEEELRYLLNYAYFWIDEGIPVIEGVQRYLLTIPKALESVHITAQRDTRFESVLAQQVKGINIVGFDYNTLSQRMTSSSGRHLEYIRHSYSWKDKYRRAVDRVRNAIFILFCLMTGMRKREMAALKFEDVTRGADGVWRVSFARYKTSTDPNYLGDADHISIPDYLGEAIDSFRKLRIFGHYFRKGYIFQPVRGGATVNRLDRMIANVARTVAGEAGVPQLHIHRFRKTIAELLINESEANIDVIRMIFDHSSYVMTLRYIARNPFLVSSVVDTLKEHFAEDFVDVVRAIHTGVYAGDAANRIADQVNKRPELFSGTVLKTTVMQYVKHLFEGGSSFRIQRTSLGTICMSQTFHECDQLPPCLASTTGLIYPAGPDFSNCQIHCDKNVILQGSQDAIEHNLKFYRTILANGARLKVEAVRELELKVSVNERLLNELLVSAAKHKVEPFTDRS